MTEKFTFRFDIAILALLSPMLIYQMPDFYVGFITCLVIIATFFMGLTAILAGPVLTKIAHAFKQGVKLKPRNSFKPQTLMLFFIIGLLIYLGWTWLGTAMLVLSIYNTIMFMAIRGFLDRNRA